MSRPRGHAGIFSIFILFALWVQGLSPGRAFADQPWMPIAGAESTAPHVFRGVVVNGNIETVAASPDGKRLVAVGAGGTVLVSEADPSHPWTQVAGAPADSLVALAVSPDGKRLIAVGEGGTVLVSGLDPSQPWTQVLGTPEKYLTALMMSPDRARLVAIGGGGTVLVSGVDPSQPWTQVSGAPDYNLHDLIASPDGKRLVAVGNGGTVLVSGADPSQPWTQVAGTPAYNLAVLVASPDGKRLVAAGNGGAVLVSGTDVSQPWSQVSGTPDNNLHALAVSPDGKRLVAVGEHGTVLVSGTDPSQPWTQVVGTPDKKLRALAASPDGKRLVAVGERGTVLVSEADPSQPWSEVSGMPSRDLLALTASPDGKRLVAVGNGGTVLVSGVDASQPWSQVSSAPRPLAQERRPDSLRSEGLQFLTGLSRSQVTVVVVISMLLTWLLLLIFLYWLAPARLVMLHEIMPDAVALEETAKLFDSILNGGVSILAWLLRALLLAPATSRRAQDAWVQARVGKARTSFGRKDTVRQRINALDLPLRIDGHRSVEPWDEIRDHLFSDQPLYMLISGQGGAGKTTLAARIALRALGGDESRPWGVNRMLPLLIEDDLNASAGEVSSTPDALADRLCSYLAGALRVAVNDSRTPSKRLVRALLRSGRVLVIVDGLSERSATTRRAFDSKAAGFPVTRLLVTSRERDLEGVTVKIEIEEIPTDGFFAFISSYIELLLKEQKMKSLDDHGEQAESRSILKNPGEIGDMKPSNDRIYDACASLDRLLHGKPCTPLLAGMWTRELARPLLDRLEAMAIGSEVMRYETAHDSAYEQPTSVANLMDRYVRSVLLPVVKRSASDMAQVGEGEVLLDRLRLDVAAIAEQELGESYQPGVISRSKALEILKTLDANKADGRLKTLLNSRLIEAISNESDSLRVSPDPVAEHMVARLCTEKIGRDALGWERFLKQLRPLAASGLPRRPEGFIAALAECVDTNTYGRDVPNGVRQELKAMTAALYAVRNAA